MNYQSAAASYNVVRNHSGVENATPHQLIEMLFEGLLERISQAKGAMQYKNIELKGRKINSAIGIVNGLRENLNKEDGGEISENLDALYVYILGILAKAHTHNDQALLDEASVLIGNIHSAWKQIG
ncbi:flagellar export chaperone FliS [Agarilytica rhodophyticola]|uniref:flagellar export chaperone FliS n=1 Tax=Agarilytica rhodophyticola TaxID=1737490 RepID=UPI001FE3E853|nr:flagellar export chaperone FliS [Agarilytica rhodophyticola]